MPPGATPMISAYGGTGLGLFLIRHYLRSFWNGEIRARVADPDVPTVRSTLSLPDPRAS